MTHYEISHRKAAIMLKHGEPGRIQARSRNTGCPWADDNNPDWNWEDCEYRWVGPGKRVELKRGMEVKTPSGETYLLLSDKIGPSYCVWMPGQCWREHVENFTHYRWPNSEDQTWLPVVQEEVLEV